MQYFLTKKIRKLSIVFFLTLFLLVQSILAQSQDKEQDESFILLMAARNAWKSKSYERAIQRYKKLTEKYPSLIEGFFEYGWLLMEAGRIKESLLVFENVTRSNPDNTEATHNYIRALLSMRYLRTAEREINALLEKSPEDKKARFFLSDLFVHQMGYEKAKAIYFDLVQKDQDKELRIRLADVNSALGEHDSASKILENLRTEFPDDPEICVRKVMNLASRQKITEAYEEVIKIKDSFLKKRAEAELLNIFGEYFEAEKKFRELLGKRPFDYALQIGLAESLVGQEDYEKAYDVSQLIKKSYPQDLRIDLDIIDILIIQRKYVQAKDELKRLSAEYSDNLRIIYLLWKLHHLQNQKEEASLTMLRLSEGTNTISEGKMLQNFMLKKQDYEGLLNFSENFIKKKLYDNAFLENYFISLIMNGKIKKGIETIEVLIEKDPENSFKNSLSEFYYLDGNKEKVIGLCNDSTWSKTQARIFYKLKDYQKSAEIYSNIIKSEPQNIQAISGLAKSLCAIGKYDQAQQILENFFKTITKEAKKAILLRLSWVPDGDELYDKLIDSQFKKLLEECPDNFDLQIARLNIFVRQKRYNDAIGGYKSLKEKMPDNPFINLRLARNLSWQKEYNETLKAYDFYLSLKPYDLKAWREKARFYGWLLEPENAVAEYKNILSKYPDNVETELEKKAKDAYWRYRYRQANKYYEELIGKEPDNAEALYDTGQLYSFRSRPQDARASYGRLLSVMPGHRQASLAMELSKLSQRPETVISYGYINQEGFGNQKLITYRPLTIAENFTLSDSLSSGIEYQNVRFSFAEESFSGNMGQLNLKYSPSLYMSLEGYIAGLSYQKIDEENINFGTSFSYEWNSGLNMRLAFEQKDLLENIDTLKFNIFTDKVSANFKKDITRRINLEAGADYSIYSNNNSRIGGNMAIHYNLLQFPRLLQFIWRLDSFGFRRESFYFSPPNYTTNSFGVEWRHFLGFPIWKEFFAETKGRTYSVYYGYSLDSRSVDFQEIRFDTSYALSKEFSVDGLVKFIRSSVYDEDRLTFSLKYTF